jgi:plastocyanin
MKNTYIAIAGLVILVIGGVLIFSPKDKAEAPEVNNPGGNGQVGCTLEAKLCPDGSSVGRSGPNCEFAACPEVKNTVDVGVGLSTAPVKQFTVSGQNFSFSPSLIKVKKGDRVKITFQNTSGFHDFKIDEFGVATKQAQAPATEVLEFTASKAGSFEYYCSVGSHRSMGMKGTLIVE